tara:strand:+ start:52 stop:561 length:510 start_codon:yes stop_codon:yes gene_type:complete
MTNLFYDILPEEIQENINGIRLSDALTRHYYMRVAQKTAIEKIIINLPVNYRYSHAELNPSDPLVTFMLDTCSKILTNNDDITGFWFPYFISPIERGLNTFYETAHACSHTGLAQPYPYRELYQERQQFHPADVIIYDKTNCSSLKLLKKLGLPVLPHGGREARAQHSS